MTDDITSGDVEGARETLLESLEARTEAKGEEYRSGFIDAVIEFDLALTEPETFREGQPYGQTD